MPPTNSEYAMINIACKELSIDKYNLIADMFGLESTKELNRQQTEELLRHLKLQGWTPKASKTSKPNNRRKNYIHIPENTPHAAFKKKILIMWKALGWKVSGIDTRCKTQFGVEKFVWIKREEQLKTLARDLNGRLRSRGLDPDAL